MAVTPLLCLHVGCYFLAFFCQYICCQLRLQWTNLLVFDCSWVTRLKSILNSGWMQLCTKTCSCKAKQGKGLLFVVHDGFKFQTKFAEISFWRKTRPTNLMVIRFVYSRRLTRRLENDFTFIRNNDSICSRVPSTASVFRGGSRQSRKRGPKKLRRVPNGNWLQSKCCLQHSGSIVIKIEPPDAKFRAKHG